MAPKNRPTHKSSHPTETSATIRKVPSQYSEGAFSRVSAAGPDRTTRTTNRRTTMTTTARTCDCCNACPCTCRERSWVVLAHLGDEGDWLDEAGARRVEATLASDGWTVTIRAPRGGEAEGTYYRRLGGDLQIVGYSILDCEELRDALERAVEAAY